MGTEKKSFISKVFTFEWMSLLVATILAFKTWLGSMLVTVWWFYFLINHRDFLCNIMGDIQMGGKKYPNAINFYKQSARTTVARMKYIKKYVITEIKYGDAEKAEETIRKIERDRRPKWIKENEIDLAYLKALVAWKKGDIDSSLNILNEILAKGENEEIQGTLAYMYLIKGNMQESLEFSKQAYEKYPNNIIAKSIFTISAYLNNNTELASELFEELVNQNLNIPDTFYYYAKYMISKDEYSKAKVALKKGLLLEGRTIICSVSNDEFKDLLDEVNDHLEDINDDEDDDFDDGFDDNDNLDGNDGFDEIASEKE